MINVEALKNKVLDLAMHGKLVPQDPNDEPASVLLERIKAEKAQLIKEKKIKKSKSLPSIEADEIPYEIPSNWEWIRVGDLGVVQTGKTPKKTEKENYNGNLPLIKPENISDDRINYQTEDYLSEIGESKAKIVFKDSLLVTCIGNLGRSYVVDRKVAFNQQINSITFVDGINPKLIHYFIMSDIFKESMYHASSATTVRILNKGNFEKLLIPLPPLKEQQRIVDKIEEIFAELDKIDVATKKYDECKELLNNRVLNLAVHGKLVPQDPNDEPASALLERIKAEKAQLIKEKKIKKSKPLPPIEADEIPYEIPDSWEWVRLGEIIYSDIGGNTPSKKNSSYWDNGTIPWLTVKDVKHDFVKDSMDHITRNAVEEKAKIIPENSFIAVTRMAIGKFTINTSKMAINQDLRALICDKNILCWLRYAYKNLNFIGQGVTVKGITRDNLLKKIIPLPPLKEQQRIVDKIEEIFTALKG